MSEWDKPGIVKQLIDEKDALEKRIMVLERMARNTCREILKKEFDTEDISGNRITNRVNWHDHHATAELTKEGKI